jgi:hypothetical protein
MTDTEELGRDGIQQFDADWDSHRRDIAEKLARDEQAFVDFERTINV